MHKMNKKIAPIRLVMFALGILYFRIHRTDRDTEN